MTPVEILGAVALLVGLGGLALVGRDLWRERNLPGHDHPEGEGGIGCLRCAHDRRQRS